MRFRNSSVSPCSPQCLHSPPGHTCSCGNINLQYLVANASYRVWLASRTSYYGSDLASPKPPPSPCSPVTLGSNDASMPIHDPRRQFPRCFLQRWPDSNLMHALPLVLGCKFDSCQHQSYSYCSLSPELIILLGNSCSDDLRQMFACLSLLLWSIFACENRTLFYIHTIGTIGQSWMRTLQFVPSSPLGRLCIRLWW